MDIEPLEIYAHDSNYAVIKTPSRNYPGCVIQGDSLAILCRMAKNIAKFAANTNINNENFLENVQELNNSLVDRLLHYQDVLSKHGIDFPHVHPFEKNDLVDLIPQDDDE